jgi:hypothetical protein
MPRYGRRYRYDDDDDDPYGRAWDNYYNECNCEYDEDGELYQKCICCRHEQRREEERARVAAAIHEAKEERLRATGWYTEVTTLRGHLDRLKYLTVPGFFEARLAIIRDLFTAAAGYDKFLAQNAKFRAVLVAKLAEFRADPRTEPLKDCMDALDAVLAGLPAREDYRTTAEAEAAPAAAAPVAEAPAAPAAEQA